MKYRAKGITIVVVEDYDEMSKRAAVIVAAQVTMKPKSVIGLATGSTPEGMYQALADMYEQSGVDFSESKSYNLDEYYPIDPKNEQSYYSYMEKNLFSKVNFDEENTHVPNGSGENVQIICEAYDTAIEDEGGIDLQVLGIGNNGHIGFNEPDIYFEAGTHLVELDEGTIQANARFFKTIDEVPTQAISMGIQTIMHAKKIIMLGSGENKAEIIDDMLFGTIDPKIPASILQLHNDVTLILDKKAAAKILKRLK